MRRAGLVLLATLLLVAMPVAAQTITTVDADHGLTDRSTIDAFEKEGVATASLASPNLRLTVAENHGDVGLKGFYLDNGRKYLRIQYNETIDRTVRIYIPSEYFHPVVAIGNEALNSDVTADFRPTDDGRYTAVTIEADGTVDAVFGINAGERFWFWSKSEARQRVSNQTGYEPPRIGSGGEWEYIPAGQLDGESSYPINASDGVTIQYDATPNESESTWLTVPDCSGDNVPVCQYERAGVDDKVYVLSKTTDAPPVRFKSGEDPQATAGSALNDLLGIQEGDRGSGLVDFLFGGD